jgi:ribosomal protein S18 acetylase RimI-like enzyme
VSDLGIRRAGSSDAAAIVRIVNAAYRKAEAFFVRGDRIEASEVTRLLERGTFLLAESRGEASPAPPASRGLTCLGEANPTPPAPRGAPRHSELLGSVYVEDRGDHGYIGLLSVDPARQRAGLGRALMTAAEETLAAAGRPRVELLVVNLRRELPAWYGKQGYREVGTRPFPPDAPNFLPCHYLVMSKRLPPAGHAVGATDGAPATSGSCAR